MYNARLRRNLLDDDIGVLFFQVVWRCATITGRLRHTRSSCTDSRSGISRFLPRWIRPKGHCRIYFRLPMASVSDSAYISPEAMAICLSSSLTAREQLTPPHPDHHIILRLPPPTRTVLPVLTSVRSRCCNSNTPPQPRRRTQHPRTCRATQG